jgi:hypothetical protein
VIDFRREVKTVTTVRHVVETPVNWIEVQKLLRTVLQDMGYGHDAEPADNLVWYETTDETLAICYRAAESK